MSQKRAAVNGQHSPYRLEEFECPTTGVVLTVRPASVHMVRNVARAYPKPMPPKEVITASGPLKGREIELKDDPYYLEEIRRWELDVQDRAEYVYAEYCVTDISDPDWEVKAQDYIDALSVADAGIKPMGTPKSVYVLEMALIEPRERNGFVSFVHALNNPTEDAIQLYIDLFRTPLQGAAPVRVESSEGEETEHDRDGADVGGTLVGDESG